jgi:transposase InsO family protein
MPDFLEVCEDLPWACNVLYEIDLLVSMPFNVIRMLHLITSEGIIINIREVAPRVLFVSSRDVSEIFFNCVYDVAVEHHQYGCAFLMKAGREHWDTICKSNLPSVLAAHRLKDGVWMTNVPAFGVNLRNVKEMTLGVMIRAVLTALRKGHPGRYEQWSSPRVVSNRAEPKLADTHFPIINEGLRIPSEGIELDVPNDMISKIPKPLLAAMRRLHVNTGHPSNADLERIRRMSGASPGLQCSTCRRSVSAKVQRPGRIASSGGFNDAVQVDLFYVKDAAGTTHTFLSMVDEATGYTLCVPALSHGAKALAALIIHKWIVWAGPPDRLIADGEKGFTSEDFAQSLGRAGSTCVTPAEYAPGQKGKVERRDGMLKGIMRKSILHLGITGAAEFVCVLTKQCMPLTRGLRSPEFLPPCSSSARK